MSTLAHGVSAVIHDVRFALRTLTKERSFALTALLTIAICIGGNSAIFSIVRSVLLKPLPIPDAERVLILSNTYQNAGGGTTPSCRSFREMQHLRTVGEQGRTAFAKIQPASVEFHQGADERHGRNPLACHKMFDPFDEIIIRQ
jgi:hypothetical protein